MSYPETLPYRESDDGPVEFGRRERKDPWIDRDEDADFGDDPWGEQEDWK